MLKMVMWHLGVLDGNYFKNSKNIPKELLEKVVNNLNEMPAETLTELVKNIDELPDDLKKK